METPIEFLLRRTAELLAFRTGLEEALGDEGTVLSSLESGLDIFTTPETVDRLRVEGYTVNIWEQWIEAKEVCRAFVTQERPK